MRKTERGQVPSGKQAPFDCPSSKAREIVDLLYKSALHDADLSSVEQCEMKLCASEHKDIATVFSVQAHGRTTEL
jgi:hypothetical protein